MNIDETMKLQQRFAYIARGVKQQLEKDGVKNVSLSIIPGEHYSLQLREASEDITFYVLVISTINLTVAYTAPELTSIGRVLALLSCETAKVELRV